MYTGVTTRKCPKMDGFLYLVYPSTAQSERFLAQNVSADRPVILIPYYSYFVISLSYQVPEKGVASPSIT